MTARGFHWLTARGPYPCNLGFTMDMGAFRRELLKYVLEPAVLADSYDPPPGARLWVLGRDRLKPNWLPTYVVTLTITPQTSWEEIAGLVAHEATHFAQFLWEQIEEREPGKEAEAYLVQAVTLEILNLLGMPRRG